MSIIDVSWKRRPDSHKPLKLRAKPVEVVSGNKVAGGGQSFHIAIFRVPAIRHHDRKSKINIVVSHMPPGEGESIKLVHSALFQARSSQFKIVDQRSNTSGTANKGLGVTYGFTRSKASPFDWIFASKRLYVAPEHLFAVLVRCKPSTISTTISLHVHAGYEEGAKPVETADLVITGSGHSTSSLTALSWAARNGWQQALETLLGKDGDGLNDTDEHGRSALSWAAGNGHTETVEALLKREGIMVNSKDDQGRTPLSWAAGHGHVTAVKLLLKESASSSEKDDDGRTPLSWAASNGNDDLITVLLDQQDVSVDDEDKQGRTPISWAAENGHHLALDLLLKHARHAIAAPLVFIDRFDAESQTAIMLAARKGHDKVLSLLITEGCSFPDSITTHDDLSFAHFYMYKGAAEGWTSLVKLLVEEQTSVNIAHPKSGRYPLCLAAEHGHCEVVKLLLEAEAAPDNRDHNSGETALCLAVRKNYADVVKELVDARADVHLRNANGEEPMEMANNPIILRMLAERHKDGKLAGTDYKNCDVDQDFTATVVDFFDQSGFKYSQTNEVSVTKLLERPYGGRVTTNPPYITWLHLPANNMRWVERLISGIYEHPPTVYRVLNSERWVKRQHHGITGRHHARFMRPHCQAFTGISRYEYKVSDGTEPAQKETAIRGTGMVLFMPYLHWDLDFLRSDRAETIAATSQNIGNQIPESTGHGNLQDTERADAPSVSPNANDGGQGAARACDKKLLESYLNDAHPLHIRRTLDQYRYHTLEDTTERDETQVVTKYQKRQNLEPKVVTMVDQLWLWVLKGTEAQPDTVITCFPGVVRWNLDDHPDRYGRTSALRSIRLSLLEDPASIQSPYDLAGLIAAKCAGIYLDNASTLAFGDSHKTVQLSEIYETTIGDVAQAEALLFQKFTRLKQDELANIQREIKLLEEIKDIIDELNTMEMLSHDQKRVLKSFEEVIKPVYQDKEQSTANTAVPETPGPPTPESSIHHEGTEEQDEDAPDAIQDTPQEKPIVGRHNSGAELIDGETQRNTQSLHIPMSNRERRSNFHHSSLPLEVVDASMGEIKGMIARAKMAYKALTLLVDLKLKHNSVISAQQSLKLTEETVKLTEKTNESNIQTSLAAQKTAQQGRTVMIFTIVTIVFLPLSLLVSFFDLDIEQFKKSEDGKLSLGYISAIIFPISTVVSAILIWVAFNSKLIEDKYKPNEGNENVAQIFNKPADNATQTSLQGLVRGDLQGPLSAPPSVTRRSTHSRGSGSEAKKTPSALEAQR